MESIPKKQEKTAKDGSKPESETIHARGASIDRLQIYTDLPVSPEVLLQEYYRPLGFVVHGSVKQGDCGPDSALSLVGAPRDLVAWTGWRATIADAMVARADDPRWQAVSLI